MSEMDKNKTDVLYFEELSEQINRGYEIAQKAKEQGKDPCDLVESLSAGDLASRVEGLMGVKGIADEIKRVGKGNIPQIIDDILDGKFDIEKNNRVEQALRVSLTILTEGVVAAPIEGISGVEINENPDGSRYLSIYFAGPIRSAGGTGQGLAVLLGDYIRQKLGLQEYRPTNDEIERYVSEIKLYNNRITRLQYLPSDDEIREIIKRTPVCVDGDPTEKVEVLVHRNLKRVKTNRVRGGMCLVIAEGIAQKASKLMKEAKKFGLDWSWLADIKTRKTKATKVTKFMDDVVGGRPIFAAPSAKGAFRLRYGRSRCSGITAKCIHPAAQVLLGGFIAVGTQLKVEQPGKGCIITPCDQIECPVVKLKSGDVLRVESAEHARLIKHQVEEILFLGDILVSYGDFLQSNQPLVPAGYCDEWWELEFERATGTTRGYGGSNGEGNGESYGEGNGKSDSEGNGKDDNEGSGDIPAPTQAIQISKKYGIPLHPRYTYHWEDIGIDDLKELVGWLSKSDITDVLSVKNDNPKAKRTLEELCIPHQIKGNQVIIEEYLPLLYPLDVYNSKNFDLNKFNASIKPDIENGFELIERISPIPIRPKVGTYIGARMGRPEKAKERKMQPAVHSLFPIGDAGGRERSINQAVERNHISVEVARYECSRCGVTIYPRCPECGARTIFKGSQKQDIKPREMWDQASKGVRIVQVKGVKGMISRDKIPEALEKGILRAKNNVYVFKDGTARFDATNAPLSHFRPEEINTGIEKLKKLGYPRDYNDMELRTDDQVLELRVQDIILPESGIKYMLRVARFVDELLVKFYDMPPFYRAEKKEDLIGHLVIGLAPHTSVGIIGRIVGFTDVNVCYAHPYWHAAKRRNCDGDEDSVVLLLDVLINFSKKFLPEKRGGKMDAPLVITTHLNPKEVDNEVHKMEIVDHYSLEFYESTLKSLNPSKVDVKIVNDILKDPKAGNLRFTHDTGNIKGPVIKSKYVRLKTMQDKVKAQLGIAEKVRAIDERKVAEILINSHFLRDTYGNLRAFSRQKFRCVKCDASYRRVPLKGKCTKCGGRLLLTVTEGSIKKYLNLSIELAEKYELSDYLKQRLMLLERDIDSLFTNDLSKQVSLSEFM